MVSFVDKPVDSVPMQEPVAVVEGYFYANYNGYNIQQQFGIRRQLQRGISTSNFMPGPD